MSVFIPLIFFCLLLLCLYLAALAFIDCQLEHQIKFPDKNLVIVKPSNQIQHFSLPTPIIHYIAKNPTTPNCYKKLVKSCKYFSTKNPLIIVSNLSFYKKWEAKPIGKIFNENIKDIKSCHKIWITKMIYSISIPISDIIPKLYKCEITKLILKNQGITFDEFLTLTPKVEALTFDNVVVKYRNGEIVMFEDIVESIPALKAIYYESNSADISKQTVENLLNIPHFKDMQKLKLEEIPEDFDFSTFFLFITNSNKSADFCLFFVDSISVAYKENIDEVLAPFDKKENNFYLCIYYADIYWRSRENAPYIYDADERDNEQLF